ncbi:MAG: YtxH domain-containing protein [Sphingobacteriaceae bacterium]
MKDQSKILAALLAGLAAGAALGILLAPESGENLRAEIAEKSKNFAEQVKRKVSAKVGELSDLKDHAVTNAKSVINDGGDALQDAKDETISAAKSKIKNTAEDAKDAIQGA